MFFFFPVLICFIYCPINFVYLFSTTVGTACTLQQDKRQPSDVSTVRACVCECEYLCVHCSVRTVFCQYFIIHSFNFVDFCLFIFLFIFYILHTIGQFAILYWHESRYERTVRTYHRTGKLCNKLNSFSDFDFCILI